MTDAEIASLRTWASALAPAGCLRSRQVLQLLDLLDARNKMIVALAERAAGQSELLSQRAARVTDSSTPTE
jgi:hypothetical protein